MNFKKDFIVSSFWALSCSYIFFAFNFGGQAVLSRVLTVKEFGLFTFVFSIKELFSLFTNFSAHIGFIYSNGTQQDYNCCFIIAIINSVFNFILSIIIIIVAMIFNFNLLSAFFLSLFVLSDIFYFFSQLFLAAHQKSMKYRLPSLISGGSNSLGMIVAIILSFLKFGVWSLVLREIIKNFILFFLSFKNRACHFSPNYNRSDLNKLLIYSLKAMFSRGLSNVYLKLPITMIGFLFGFEFLGHFNQALFLCFMLNRLISPLTENVAFSFYSNLKDNFSELSNKLTWITFVLFRLYLPFLLAILFFGKPLILLYLGPQWDYAGVLFSKMWLFIIIYPIFMNFQSICYAVAKQYLILMTIGIMIFFSVISVIGAHSVNKPFYIPYLLSFSLLFACTFIFIFLYKSGIKLNIVNSIALPIIIWSPIIVICSIMNNNLIRIISLIIGVLVTLLMEFKKYTLFYSMFKDAIRNRA